MTTDNRTNEPTDEQVEAAARATHEANKKFYPGMWQVAWELQDPRDIEGYLDGARAALEAATRVPVQGEPNDDRETLSTERIDEIATDALDYYREEGLTVRGLAQASVRMGHEAVSRAVVPDAATEQVTEYSHLGYDEASRKEIVAAKLGAEGERDSYKAQYDAATAAIERVRVAHREEDNECVGCSFEAMPDVGFRGVSVPWPCPTVAALDGAPEPEDEPCTVEAHSWDHYRPEQIDPYWIKCTALGKHDEHEDSHTGLKWRSGLPVEGESKP